MVARYVSSLLFAAVVALPVATATAQSPLAQDELFLSRTTSNERLPAVRLGLDEGLSQSSIYAIHQDQQGFMWFGTQAGLNKYDGYSFTVYKHDASDPGSISDHFIHRIYEDAVGQLWLATNDGGLNRFDPDTEQFTRFLPNPDDSTSYSGGQIYSIEEMRDRSLWIGTANGLNRFDPHTDSFVQYKHDTEDANTLSGNHVGFSHEGADGMLWLVAGGPPRGASLNRLDPKTGRVTRFRQGPEEEDESLPSGQIVLWTWAELRSSLLAADDGQLWFGTRSPSELNRIDPETGQITRYEPDPENPISQDGPTVIHEDQSGRLWAAVGSGLSRFDPTMDRFVHYKNRAPDPRWSHRILTMYEDRSGLFWLIILTEDTRGVAQDIIRLDRFDPETGRFTHFDTAPDDPTTPNIPIIDILREDEEGQLWFRSFNEGLDRYDPHTDTFTRYAYDHGDPTSISDNFITHFYTDRTGIVWFGTRLGGINKINAHPPKFSHVPYDPSDAGSLSNASVRAFYENREGVLWVGTDDGLNRFDAATGRFTHYKHIPILQRITSAFNRTFAFAEDQGGQFWVGTDLGLYQFDRKAETFKHIRLNPEEENNHFSIRQLYEDRSGVLWVGTGQGLYRQGREQQAFTRFHHAPEDSTSLSHDWVRFIYEDADNQLWIGTSGGLNRFDRDTETFTAYRHDPGDPTSLSSDAIRSIYSTPENPDILWIGTNGGGLNRFDVPSSTFKRYTEASSAIPGHAVYTILPDEEGHLWMGTNNGLSRFDPRTDAFKTYDTDDGLQSKAFHTGAAYKASNGAMFFGGTNGFNIFYPEQVQDDLNVPQIALTSLHVYNASSDTGADYGTLQKTNETLTLPHDENDLTFEFAALHYANPAKNQYRFRLEPYEATWSEPSSQRQVRYSNLDPGTYTFKLQASNSDGVWTEEGLIFQVEVRPPWWQTTWAYVLYAVLFALGIFITDRVQRRRLLRKAAEQARIERAELEAQAAEAQARALQAENERKEVELEKAKEVEYAYSALQEAHEDLKTTQDQLIHSEKMASLGSLTAGIAHEIKNPLNFVNNFAEVNEELTDELTEALAAGEQVDDILADLKQNAAVIAKHGKRADSIVKSMMEHARGGEGQRQATNINAFVEEYFNLAYHGMRAKLLDFNATLDRDYDEAAGSVEIVPQEMGRVLINLLNNAFYVVHEKAQSVNGAYDPTVMVSTKDHVDTVEIRVSDNGVGIAEEIQEKIFEPFFTTKPTGQGNTGLGLSLSYDIITQGHSGSLSVESEEGQGAVFVITLPR